MAIVFDLDNTLVDTVHLEGLRKSRQWSEVYRRIDSVQLFPSIRELITNLDRESVFWAIVTHSPKSYASRIVESLKLNPLALISYHDLNGNLKPSPYGYLAALGNQDLRNTIAVGDTVNDLVAADAAGIKGGYAAWCKNPTLGAEFCHAQGWQYLISPLELIGIDS